VPTAASHDVKLSIARRATATDCDSDCAHCDQGVGFKYFVYTSNVMAQEQGVSSRLDSRWGAGSHWSAIARPGASRNRDWFPSACGCFPVARAIIWSAVQRSGPMRGLVSLLAENEKKDSRSLSCLDDPKTVSHEFPQICCLPPLQNVLFSMPSSRSLLLHSSCGFVVRSTTKCEACLVSRLGHARFMAWRSLVKAPVKCRRRRDFGLCQRYAFLDGKF
jgi:hypothetical protein